MEVNGVLRFEILNDWFDYHYREDGLQPNFVFRKSNKKANEDAINVCLEFSNGA